MFKFLGQPYSNIVFPKLFSIVSNGRSYHNLFCKSEAGLIRICLIVYVLSSLKATSAEALGTELLLLLELLLLKTSNAKNCHFGVSSLGFRDGGLLARLHRND